MIHAEIAPCISIFGTTCSRTLDRTASSDQSPLPTKCSKDWCCAAVRSGAVIAAIGHRAQHAYGMTLLRSAGISMPVQ